jgi:hypothetical protein
MPFVDRRVAFQNFTSPNARAADVASRLTSTIAPIVQQKIQSAFRVQGIEGTLLNRLSQGMACSCTQRNNQVSSLSPDGKASPGAINRLLTGAKFGISDYGATADDDFDAFHSNDADFNGSLNDNRVGPDSGHTNQASDIPVVGDNGQYSPDLENMFGDFDLSHLGLTDVSCPICFGTNYVGGYSMFRGQRMVFVPAHFSSTGFLDPMSFELSSGTHTTNFVLPKGATKVECFRLMRASRQVQSNFIIDGTPLTTDKHLLSFCDGKTHSLVATTSSPFTHLEIVLSLTKESIYFEIPKLTKSQDIALIDPLEPFQIIVSPEVPYLNAHDIIIEQQHGKVLIVGQVNPWNTRNKAMLGHEAQVRVCQPQELYNMLSHRLPITSQKATTGANVASNHVGSGFIPSAAFSF